MDARSFNKWVLRGLTLVLALAGYAGAALGGRDFLKVVQAGESEAEAFVCHEATETRSESLRRRYHREPRRHATNQQRRLALKKTSPRLQWAELIPRPLDTFTPSSPLRAPPKLS
jgi:hypothetical protein